VSRDELEDGFVVTVDSDKCAESRKDSESAEESWMVQMWMEDEYDSDSKEEQNGYAMADEYLEQYEEDGNS